MEISIKEVSNGYYVSIDKKEYAYGYNEILKMLEHVGKEVMGKKVAVEVK